MRVILIGFMGVGKTSVGKRLAKKLNFDFIDTDYEIELVEKKSISKIFEQDGEKYFTAESAYKYWYKNHYTPNGLGDGGEYPNKRMLANFLYAVCQTDYYCGSTGEFRDRINEYFKSIGGITTDGVNYMVTFEQLLKAYINLQNMPEGFYVGTGDKDNLFIIESPNDDAEETAEVINDRVTGIYNDACEDIISYGDILN